MI
ncbi:hypothetical protein ECEC1846_2218, partial [Escherichia coli EC1846]|jgi:hypothetical protein